MHRNGFIPNQIFLLLQSLVLKKSIQLAEVTLNLVRAHQLWINRTSNRDKQHPLTMAHQATLDVSASAITNLHWVITINEELDHITNGLEIITDGSLELLCNLKLVVWKGLTSVFGRHSSYDTTCILSQFKRIWQRPTFFILQNGHVDQMRLPWSWHIVCLWDGLQSLLKIRKNIRYFSLCAYLLKRSVLTPIYLPV